MKKEKNVNINADDMIVVENHKSKPMGKVTKWLSVAAVFCFIVAGITLIGITSGNNQVSTSEVTPLESNAPVTESQDSILSVPPRPNVDDPITSKDEHRVDEWEKAMNETSALGKVRYEGNYKIDGQELAEDEFFHIEYKGGEITIDGSFDLKCGEVIPEKTSVGYYVVVNGVVQELFMDEKSIGTTFIHYNTKEDIENKSTGGSFSISFTPTIAQTDKDMKEFNISLVKVHNPHYRVSPFYVSAGLNHMSQTAGLWKLDIVDTPIEKVLENTSDSSVNYEKTVIDDPDTNQGIQILDAEGSPYEIKCDGTSVSVKTVLRTGGNIENTRYRIVYLVNGIPAVLANGETYIEIDVEPSCQYDFDIVAIDGVQPYDTIDAIEFICDGKYASQLLPSSFMHSTIYPEDYVRKVG